MSASCRTRRLLTNLLAEPLTINVQQAAKAAPAVYEVPGSTEVEPLAAFASFDGSGAAASYLPSIAFYSASGLLISRSFPSSAVAAGASADVSYFPGLGVGGGGGGGGAGGTKQVAVILDTADALGNGFAALTTFYGFTNVRRVLPALPHDAVVSSWTGAVRVPQDYGSTPVILLSMVVDNTLAAKAAAIRVSTSVVADAVSEDTAYTDEAYVNVAIPTTANERFDQSYALTTTPVAGATLNVQVTRDGTRPGDTLTLGNVLIWECLFQYEAV